MPASYDTQRHSETHVANAIESLGDKATTVEIAKLTGLPASTIKRTALRLGYTNEGHGKPWREDSAPELGQSGEILDALNRIADAISGSNSSNGSITVKPGATREQAGAAIKDASMDWPLERRKQAVETLASWLLADTLQ